jgi:hypothetical protein
MSAYGSAGRPGARDGVAPPEWPAEVPPPGVPGWERRAIAWLFDACPPDFRGYELLRRQPVVLARVAAGQVAASVEACRRGLATVRADLREVVPPEVVDETIALYETEGARLSAVGRGIAVVAQALEGRRFVPRL